jgi:hypothetical protein
MDFVSLSEKQKAYSELRSEVLHTIAIARRPDSLMGNGFVLH